MPQWAYKRVMELALQRWVHQVPYDPWQWATDLTAPVPPSPRQRENPIEARDSLRPFAQPSIPDSAGIPLTAPDSAPVPLTVPDAAEQEVEVEPAQGEGEWGEGEDGDEWERRCYLQGQEHDS